MFITISNFLVRAGEEDAIIALYEDLQHTQLSKAQGTISGELLRSIENPREFVAIMHYETKEAAQALANKPEHHAWFQRMISLSENGPLTTDYTSEWP